MTDARRDILSVTPFLLTPNRSLFEIGTNYAVAESEWYMGSAVLNFDMSVAGRRAVDLLVTDIQRTFNGTRWTQNGPDVLERVLHVMCGTKHVSVVRLNDCLIYKFSFHSLLGFNNTRLEFSHTRFVFQFLQLQL
jgi:acetolactate synthase regulatory subunit